MSACLMCGAGAKSGVPTLKLYKWRPCASSATFLSLSAAKISEPNRSNRVEHAMPIASIPNGKGEVLFYFNTAPRALQALPQRGIMGGSASKTGEHDGQAKPYGGGLPAVRHRGGRARA